MQCIPNSDFMALNPAYDGGLNSHPGGGGGNGFLVGLTSSNISTSISTPVLLAIVVIVTVIFGVALSILGMLLKQWYNSKQNYVRLK